MFVKQLCRTAICLLFFASTLSRAEVTAVSDHGFVSEHRLILAATPDDAMAAMINDVHLWWDASHSFGGRAAGFSIDATAGGCFCEQIEDGGSVQHLRVVNVLPGKSITFHGGLGPLQSMAVTGAMTFAFEPHAQGSELKYRYSVSGFLPGGLQPLAGPVDQVQLGQLKRLQEYLLTNKPLN